MFANAYKIAAKYTFPIHILYRRYDGVCQVLTGSFVVINADGWIVTANHITLMFTELLQSYEEYDTLAQQREVRLNDARLSAEDKQHWVEANPIAPDLVTNLQLWWGGVSATNILDNVTALDAMDLVIGQLDAYLPPDGITYPRFWHPDNPTDPGTSLCKMGYPPIIDTDQPTFDEQTNEFVFPEGAVMPALFPLDGILTRHTALVNNQETYSFPQLFVETSTPSLRGHSGGPLIDVQGNVWGIQSQTRYYPLGFLNEASTQASGEPVVYSYLNLGYSIHSATIVGFLRQNKVAFDLSLP